MDNFQGKLQTPAPTLRRALALVGAALCALLLLQSVRTGRRERALGSGYRQPSSSETERLLEAPENYNPNTLEMRPIPPLIMQVIVGTKTPNNGRAIENLHKLVPSNSVEWIKMHPGFEYRLIEDDAMDLFVEKNYPKIHRDVYKRISKPILAADLARYLLLYHYGGIYTDLDTTPRKHFSQWSAGERVNVIVSIEGDMVDDARPFSIYFERDLQICQWTLVSSPRHPLFRRVINTVAKGLKDAIDSGSTAFDVLNLTGPGKFSDIVLEFLRDHYGAGKESLKDMTSPKRFGDILVLPMTGFCPGNNRHLTKPLGQLLENQESLIVHHYLGSWR